MKKPAGFLLTAALLLTLCACGASPAPSATQTPAPTDAQPARTQPPAAPEAQPTAAPGNAEAAPGADEGTADPDGLNEFGLPDLSGFTAGEIWDMYLNPDNWDEAVLTMADGSFDFDDAEPYADPEVDPDYSFDLGDWRDYDPGDWAPGPDEITQIDGGTPDNTGGALPGSELPEEYAFLMPEGLRDGDLAVEEDGMFLLNLPDRGEADYAEMVQRAADAGYSQNVQNMDLMGMKMYEAGNGSRTITILLQSGTIMVSFE